MHLVFLSFQFYVPFPFCNILLHHTAMSIFKPLREFHLQSPLCNKEENPQSFVRSGKVFDSDIFGYGLGGLDNDIAKTEEKTQVQLNVCKSSSMILITALSLKASVLHTMLQKNGALFWFQKNGSMLVLASGTWNFPQKTGRSSSATKRLEKLAETEISHDLPKIVYKNDAVINYKLNDHVCAPDLLLIL